MVQMKSRRHWKYLSSTVLDSLTRELKIHSRRPDLNPAFHFPPFITGDWVTPRHLLPWTLAQRRQHSVSWSSLLKGERGPWWPAFKAKIPGRVSYIWSTRYSRIWPCTLVIHSTSAYFVPTQTRPCSSAGLHWWTRRGSPSWALVEKPGVRPQLKEGWWLQTELQSPRNEEVKCRAQHGVPHLGLFMLLLWKWCFLRHHVQVWNFKSGSRWNDLNKRGFKKCNLDYDQVPAEEKRIHHRHRLWFKYFLFRSYFWHLAYKEPTPSTGQALLIPCQVSSRDLFW